MIYADTSSFLKLLLSEPESEATRQAVAAESTVLVSSLTQLESEGQIRMMQLSGEIRAARVRKLMAGIGDLLDCEPFQRASLPGSTFETARSQQRDPAAVYCRTLDRLHLAAMADLGVRRLLTNDRAQAAAARILGFEVVVPGTAA